MRTPATFVAAIKALQIAAPDDVRHYFTVRENGFFTIDIMVIETVACWGQLPR